MIQIPNEQGTFTEMDIDQFKENFKEGINHWAREIAKDIDEEVIKHYNSK